MTSWLDSAWAALRPPPKLTLSEWADDHYVLSPESSAAPGRWRTRSYQRGILDAITDKDVERVTIMKSARIGFTLSLNAAIGYFMHEDPCPIMVVQPTVDTAKKYSKEFITPMLRDVPALQGLVAPASVKTSSRTVLDKSFPGGVLSMVGANSGAGFRMSSRRVVIFDEVDAYPPSAGDEGDPIALGENRAREYWNRKIIAGSTPLVSGSSRIEELFEAGDQRRYYVPCPQCGHMDFLRFHRREGDEEQRGHRMVWPKDQPGEACFECSANGCVIEEHHKRAMVDAGEWRADAPTEGDHIHASFHIWAAYSLSPNATWGQIATEFVAATKLGTEKLQTFVNTVLGETWKERGEAPDWKRLHDRCEPYEVGTVPSPAIIVLTAGVDVQKDRFVYEVVGWAPSKESWSVDAGELYGDTADDATWLQLDALLERSYVGADGATSPIAMLAIDSSAFTQTVYNWGRQKPMSRVIACKGVPGPRLLVAAASPVEINFRGRRIQNGYRIFPVGVDVAKPELYGWLGLAIAEDGTVPPGYCHFPAYDPEFFKQLTAEYVVKVINRATGRARLEWHVQPNRENHALDARILARVAAAVLGIDRLPRGDAAAAESAPPAPQPQSLTGERKGSFWDRGRGRGGWLGRRR